MWSTPFLNWKKTSVEWSSFMASSFPFLFIMGPTGVGKSELAHLAAQREKGEIVNCDSLQCYQGLDIGTAKPSSTERKPIPHHLFDIVELGGQLTAGDYRRKVLSLWKEPPQAPLFFVGGSGFYFQALEKGMYEVPEIPENIRRELSYQDDLPSLYEELKRKDPQTAQKIKTHDRYRILRALGVIRASGKTLTEIRYEFAQKRKTQLVPVMKIGLTMERNFLRKRILQRTQQMLNQGLVEETESLMKKGYSHWPPLNSVGYKECQNFLKGQASQNELLESIVTKTMQLAKRQMTWFRKDLNVRWYKRQEVENWKEPLQWIHKALEVN